MPRQREAAVALVLLSSAACVHPEDDPSNVKDLRVLAISVEPPELMASDCASTLASRSIYASEVTFTVLIADPNGGGRRMRYELFACADPSERACATVEDRMSLATGLTAAGPLALRIRPGAVVLGNGTPLLQRVIEIDDFRGFGGIRMPLVIHLVRGDEKIYAQKLMVFSCRMFPEMMPNANPVLPGLRVNGDLWPGNVVMQLHQDAPFKLSPEDFSDREEDYVLPSFDLHPVHLKERWKISWHTDLGKISPTETGGTDFGGQESRHLVEWKPGSRTEQDVVFWVVVRDGRGGESWLRRRAHYAP